MIRGEFLSKYISSSLIKSLPRAMYSGHGGYSLGTLGMFSREEIKSISDSAIGVFFFL